jgi:uncharacterized protein YjbI with pentapeptide repeats
MNLRGLDLAGMDFSNADLRNADLTGANLTNADLRGADLSAADLSAADLSEATLENTQLSNSVMNETRGRSITGIPASFPEDHQLIDGQIISASTTGSAGQPSIVSIEESQRPRKELSMSNESEIPQAEADTQLPPPPVLPRPPAPTLPTPPAPPAPPISVETGSTPSTGTRITTRRITSTPKAIIAATVIGAVVIAATLVGAVVVGSKHNPSYVSGGAAATSKNPPASRPKTSSSPTTRTNPESIASAAGAASPSTTQAPTATQPGAQAKSTGPIGGAREHDWNNEEYDVDWGVGRTRVKFRDGIATGPATPAVQFTEQARVASVHFGDLNDDGKDDAIVSITTDLGPTFSVTEQHVFTGPELVQRVGYVPGEFIGDDWERNDIPTVTYTYNQDDPRCCPSTEDRKVWDIQDGRLVVTYELIQNIR